MKVHLTDDSLKSLRVPEGQAQLVVFDTKVTGFGVVVGARGASFIVNRRVDAKLHREKIGTWGEVNAQQARKLAITMLGDVTAGRATPAKVKQARKAGPTLAEACALYTAWMRKSGKRPSSITVVEREIGDRKSSYVKAWLDRALASIEGRECRARHEQLTRDSGTHVANRAMRELRAIWNFIAKEAAAGAIEGLSAGHVFPACPTIAVRWNTENDASDHVERRGEPIRWEDLPTWNETVMKLKNGVRRDYHLFVLLTGIRRTDALTVRWEHVNLDDEPMAARVWSVKHKEWQPVTIASNSLLRPSPKGGAKRAFIVPISPAIADVLTRRKAENEIAGDDRGWVFPSVALKSDAKKKTPPCYACRDLGCPPHAAGEVVHMGEPKEKTDVLVSPHRLRDTYTTALAELKDPPLSPYVIDSLTNHAPPKGSVTAEYIGTLDLAEPQRRVSEFLVSKFTRPENEKHRGLKAVA